MDNPHYNCISSAERELDRPKVKAVLAKKDKTGTWLSEQMGRNIFNKREHYQTRLKQIVYDSEEYTEKELLRLRLLKTQVMSQPYGTNNLNMKK